MQIILLPKNFLKLAAIMLTLFSVALIGFPHYVMQIFTHNPTGIGEMFMQFLGASLVGHAYLNWHAHQLDKTGQKLILYMNTAALFFAVVISLAAMIISTPSWPLGLILIMHTMFLGGFVSVIVRVRAVTV